MMRRPDWPERLHEYLDARRGAPFAWGSNDCATFAAGAIEAMTGERPALPEYATVEAAARILATSTLRDRVDALYAPQIAPAMAQRGDLALMIIDGRETLGVFVDHWIAGPGETGMLLVPRDAAVAAWAV